MTNDPVFVNTLIKMLMFLLLLAGGAATLLYLLKRGGKLSGPGVNQELISVLATKPIAPKKSIALIRVPGSVLVVGIAGETLSLLSKIEEPALVDELSQYTPSPAFPTLLNQFRKTFPKHK